MTNRVLVVDDDALFREQLVDRLQKAGFEVTACDSITATLERLDRLEQLQGILLDMRLDDGPGLDLITPLRARFPTARLVMLTGYGSIPTAMEATRRGADDYLLKPATLDDIVRALAADAGCVTPALPDGPPSLERLEWDYIQHVLQRHEGNISAAARDLGIDRRTLQRRLKKRPSAQHFQRDRH